MNLLAPVPCFSAGIGLRTEHITDVLVGDIAASWFELLADNWFVSGGILAHYLEALADRHALTLHGVGLSLGGGEPLDIAYLDKVKALIKRSDARWYSEHLCFCKTGQHVAHDLLPLPYTEESIKHLAARIRQVQDTLDIPFMVENVSSYLTYKSNEMSEAEFVAAISQESGCGLLLDINNIYVSERNHGDNGQHYIDTLHGCNIGEFHLAGYEDKGTHVIDAHNNPVSAEVWSLYEYALKTLGPRPTIIEWDNDLPEFSILEKERRSAQTRLDTCLFDDVGNVQANLAEDG